MKIGIGGKDVNRNIEMIEKGSCPIAREEIYKRLKEIIEQSDSNCNCVHFAWF